MKRFFRIATSLLFSALSLSGISACGGDDEPSEPTPGAKPDPVPDQEETAPAASSTVIYQANPRFFASENAFDAITANIDRIADMGCNVLWLMPICEPGQEKSVNSPYCIRDYRGINPRYGTLDNLKTLISAAHAKGIKVILDWVANHTAWDHAWISEHPEYYKHNPDGSIVAPNGWSDVAQLDWNKKEVADAMKSDMLYWVENTDIDGFRCDYAEGVPHSFWADAIKTFRTKDPDFIMLAESSDYSFYNDNFDMVYDWPFSSRLSTLMKGGQPAKFFEYSEEAWNRVPDGKSILRYAFNHDVAAENDFDRMFGTPEGVVAAYVLTAMLPGTPMIYSLMDTEGQRGKQSFFNYRPLVFSESLSKEYGLINNAYRKSALARGGKLTTGSDPDVAVLTWTNGNNKLLVMVNCRNEKKSVKTPIAFTGTTMTDLISGRAGKMPVAVELEPYGYAFYLTH